MGVGGINYVINVGGQRLAEEKRKVDCFSKMADPGPRGRVNKSLRYSSNYYTPFK